MRAMIAASAVMLLSGCSGVEWETGGNRFSGSSAETSPPMSSSSTAGSGRSTLNAYRKRRPAAFISALMRRPGVRRSRRVVRAYRVSTGNGLAGLSSRRARHALD